MEDIEFKDLINELFKYISSVNDIDSIGKAYLYAQKAHEGVKRKSGKPYITHPLGVAFILAQNKMNPKVIMAALLHDVVEDTDCTIDDIKKEFGEKVATIVEGVTKISIDKFPNNNQAAAYNTRKLLKAIGENIEIFIVKAVDRLYNMRTLNYMPVEKQIAISNETMNVYVPLCHALGMHAIKSELEDLAFKYLNRKTFDEISQEIEEIKERLSDTLLEMENAFIFALNDKRIPNNARIKFKNVYRVYQKLIEHYEINSVHDLVAIKIAIGSARGVYEEAVTNCFKALHIIHSKYHHIDIKFKDYITNPKPNMYQSIHTTLFVPENNLVQVQIRTNEMDDFADNGIITRFGKSKDGNIVSQDIKKNLAFFTQLDEILKSINDDIECIEQINREILTTTVGVYTTDGDIIDLPKGSTPIDFAYRQGEEIGNSLSKAVINGRFVPLNTKLKDKDRVKIITSSDSTGPEPNWLELATTLKAKQKIIKRLGIKN